jgi:nucleoside-diphosphate-sugar epimerase
VLAAAAAKAGVRRFVFMSSIKVNGEKTDCAPFTEQDTPHPEDSYGISKWEAEQTLHDLIAGSTMQSVVLRAPLIYGAGAKGNLLQLMRAVDRGVPLPFSSIRNRRSLLHIKNLIDAIVLCMDHPAASNMTYLLADDEGVSTPDLIRGIASALGKTARLFPCHPELLKITCAAIGKLGVANRLSVSLQIDSRKIRRELNWHPRHNMMNGLREMAQSLR